MILFCLDILFAYVTKQVKCMSRAGYISHYNPVGTWLRCPIYYCPSPWTSHNIKNCIPWLAWRLEKWLCYVHGKWSDARKEGGWEELFANCNLHSSPGHFHGFPIMETTPSGPFTDGRETARNTAACLTGQKMGIHICCRDGSAHLISVFSNSSNSRRREGKEELYKITRYSSAGEKGEYWGSSPPVYIDGACY